MGKKKHHAKAPAPAAEAPAAPPDDDGCVDLAALDPLSWRPEDAKAYVAEHLYLPHVGEIFVRRHIGGSTLVHMTEGDLREDEPHGLGLSPADTAVVMTLIRKIKELPQK